MPNDESKIKIVNEKSLIKVIEVISWLDEKRWSKDDKNNFINFCDVNFYGGKDRYSCCEKILTHWLCYITDRKMPFGIVWDRGGYVFSDWVYEYSENKMLPDKIRGHYGEYEEEEEGKKKKKKKTGFKGINDEKNFSSRFHTTDIECIIQTLEILYRYKAKVCGKTFHRNIVAFILHFVERYNKGNDDCLVRVACALHLLAYNLDKGKANSGKITEILEDKDKFEKALEKFKEKSTEGKKRLWCCIRDYKKGMYSEFFKEAIKEIVPDEGKAEELIEKWDSLPMDQIELPGDVWNDRPSFKENLIVPLLNISKIPKGEMPKTIREVYNKMNIKDFYPEKFDVTFDFVPRMCEKKMCDICPFGGGSKLVCNPKNDKYCPVALFVCGYIVKCNIKCEEDKCIIKDDIGKGICRGKPKKHDGR